MMTHSGLCGPKSGLPWWYSEPEVAVETAFVRECAARGWAQTGAFLHAYAQAAQLVGEQPALSSRQVRRWRQPHPPKLRARTWRVLTVLFGMSPQDLGFSLKDGIPAAVEEELMDMDRREFVAGSLGTATGAVLSAPGSHVGSTHIAELRTGLRSLYVLDDAYGGDEVRSLAVRHLRRLERIINTASYPDTIGRQLHLLAGETAEHVAWLAFDSERQELASRYWGEALTKATLLRDDSLGVLVLASMSLQALHQDRPRDAVELAQAARRQAEPLGSPVVLSILALREARALARMQDGTGARRSMAQAMKLLDRGDKGRSAPEWAAYHQPAELDFAQGRMYADMGHHRAGIPFMRAALERQDRAYGRNRVLYRLTLAHSLIMAGEADEGAAAAVESLEHMAEVESSRVRSRAAEVRDLLATSDASAARDTVEMLDEYVN